MTLGTQAVDCHYSNTLYCDVQVPTVQYIATTNVLNISGSPGLCINVCMCIYRGRHVECIQDPGDMSMYRALCITMIMWMSSTTNVANLCGSNSLEGFHKAQYDSKYTTVTCILAANKKHELVINLKHFLMMLRSPLCSTALSGLLD